MVPRHNSRHLCFLIKFLVISMWELPRTPFCPAPGFA